MNDLISRKAAIYAVTVGAMSAAMVFGRTEHGMTALKETIRAIKELPSAQPEIIRCKECRYYGESLPDVDTRMICHKTALNYKPDDFCSYAERREDG